MKDSRKHGYPHHPGQHPQSSRDGFGGERPMFANDPRDRAQQGAGQYIRPDAPHHDAGTAAGQDRPQRGPAFQQPERAHGDAGAAPFQGGHAQEPPAQPGWQAPESPDGAGQGAGQDAEELAALRAEVEALKAQLADAEQKAGENHEHFVRASAEMENVRRRSKEEIDKARKFAIEGFAESLLPVCDSLEMALTVETPTVESIREGAQATLRQLQQALERNKVQVVDPLGQRFDPNSQQAISMQPTPGVPANHVAAVLQKGYLINDRVLRPAMVVVSQGG